MKIILLGPQGAGKGTQAQRLASSAGAKHISTGDIVRAEIKAGSELGQKVQDFNDRGELVPDEIIVEMAKPYLGDAESWTRPWRSSEKSSTRWLPSKRPTRRS
jgi:adenylate kinase